MTKDEFCELLVKALKASGQRVVVDFDRAVLGQKGHGHFSPLAAYNSGADRFLLMDVARYKLAPCWVTSETLFNSMSTVDHSSGKSRGALIVCRRSSTSL